MVNEIADPGAIEREPVTSVATNVVPTRSPSADADPLSATLADPAVDDATADDVAAADELPAAGVEVLVLAHAVSPVSSAIAAAAANRLVERIFVLTCIEALIPPQLRLRVPFPLGGVNDCSTALPVESCRDALTVAYFVPRT